MNSRLPIPQPDPTTIAAQPPRLFGIKNTLHILSAVILFLASCSPALHDKNSAPAGSPPPFDRKRFNERYRTALYLLHYERAARIAADSVANEPESVKITLGKDRFCVKIHKDWHAVFGNYDTLAHAFIQTLHYVITNEGKALKTGEILDSAVSTTAARSLRTCLRQSDSIVSFYRSWYVNIDASYEKDGSGNNHVWLLPGTADGKAVYGIEYSFDVSSCGDSVIRQEFTGRKLRYYMPDKNKEAVLGNDYSDIPALGNILFALRHHDDFKKIVLYNKKWESSLIKDPQTREFSWIHTAK